jgi:hypothetical protein
MSGNKTARDLDTNWGCENEWLYGLKRVILDGYPSSTIHRKGDILTN